MDTDAFVLRIRRTLSDVVSADTLLKDLMVDDLRRTYFSLVAEDDPTINDYTVAALLIALRDLDPDHFSSEIVPALTNPNNYPFASQILSILQDPEYE